MASGHTATELTVSGLWADAVALLRPHVDNIVWIAAMFLFLPQLTVELLVAKPTVPGTPGASTLAAIGIVAAFGLIGQLACIAVLNGGPTAPPTVGAAIQRGLQLTPRAILAVLMVLACLVPIALLFGAAAAALGVDPQQMTKPTLSLTLLLTVMVGVMLFGAARLFSLNVVLVREPHSAWESVRRAWTLSRSAAWPLVGFLLTMMLAIPATTGLLKMVGDVVVSLMFGDSVIDKLIVATLMAAISAMFSLISLSAGVVAYRSFTK